jgi:hypothetical protein
MFITEERPTIVPVLQTMDFPKVGCKIWVSFDSPREINPHQVLITEVRQEDKAEATEDRDGD